MNTADAPPEIGQGIIRPSKQEEINNTDTYETSK